MDNNIKPILKSKLKLFIEKFGENKYLSELREYINNNQNDTSAKIDLLQFLLKIREYEEFENLYHYLRKKNINNSLIYRTFARYLLFVKKDFIRAKNVLQKAISLNVNEPAWVYYFTGKEYVYYEKIYDKLFYTAIPKNASTSLKTFVLKEFLNQENVNPHSVFGNPFFKSTHYADDELKNGIKTVVLRKPEDRFLSYFSKNILEEDSLAFEYGLSSKNVSELFGLKLQPTLEEFIENFELYCVTFNDVLHHTLPQAAYIGNLEKYDLVCDIKEVDNLVTYVAEAYNKTHLKKAPNKMVTSNKKEDILKPEIQDFLRSIYAHDYEILSFAAKKINLSEEILKYTPRSNIYTFLKVDKS
ncbi:MAG: sulfotransferase family 2 domain-containing protein [Campylobacterota bacterium]|nr:sulfotransferase family 2 domain-containing protein [Campylobacterota bacterium]